MKSRKKNGYVEVFCKYVVRNGKVIRPKRAKCLHFYVKAR